MSDTLEKMAGRELVTQLIALMSIESFRSILTKYVLNSFISSHNNTNVEYDFTHTKPDPLAIDYLKERVIVLSDKTAARVEGDLKFSLLEGLKANESIDQITARLESVFKDGTPRWQLERIARSEVINSQNAGRISAYKSSGSTNYKMWISGKGVRVCAQCKRLNGQIQPLDKPFVDPETGESWDHPIAHPNGRCLYENPLIYTVDGWKSISKINVGDLVLTHKGRFRHVTETHKNPKKESRYKITLVYDGYDDTKFQNNLMTLTVTPDHPFMTERGWIEAQDLNYNDKIQSFADVCKNCDGLYPKIPNGIGETQYYKYCSEHCGKSYTASDQWENTDMRDVVIPKISKSMKEQYASGERSKYRSPEQIKTMLDGQKRFWSESEYEIERNIVTRNSSDRMKYLWANESFRWINSRNKNLSNLEILMKDALQRRGINFTSQEPVKNYLMDFAIPDLKIGIECDGEYWHQDKDKEIKRDNIIKSEGWDILHFRGTEILDDVELCVDSIERLMKNHNGEYNFMYLPIKKIEITEPPKIARMTWNLSVEEDESFVAKSFVVHNCSTVPLRKLPDETITISGMTYDASRVAKVELPGDLFKSEDKTPDKTNVVLKTENKSGNQIEFSTLHLTKFSKEGLIRRKVTVNRLGRPPTKEYRWVKPDKEDVKTSTLSPDNVKEIISLAKLGMKGGVHDRETDIIVLKDDSHALYKRMGRSAVFGEVSAYKLNKMLGWNVVPETTSGDFGEGHGSAQRLIEGGNSPYSQYSQREGFTPVKEQHLDGLAKIFVMDTITGNADRHNGNVIIKGDEVYAIDNEFFGNESATPAALQVLRDMIIGKDTNYSCSMIEWLGASKVPDLWDKFSTRVVEHMKIAVKNRPEIIKYYSDDKNSKIKVDTWSGEKAMPDIIKGIENNFDRMEKYIEANK